MPSPASAVDGLVDPGAEKVSGRGRVVAVVEDHPLFRAALVEVLGGDPDTGEVRAYGSAEEFLASGDVVDVVVSDLGLPGLHGPEAIARICAVAPAVLAVSGQSGRDVVQATLRAGARGFADKAASPEEFLTAVAAVVQGETWLSPSLGAEFLVGGSAPAPVSPAAVLGPRERQVLALVAEGLTDQEIARSLYITLATVRSHLDRIRAKTGRRRRAELTRMALEDPCLHADRPPRAGGTG